MSFTVTADNGQALDLASLPQELGYNGTNITSITVEYNGITYIQTITYAGNLVTNVSRFEAQS